MRVAKTEFSVEVVLQVVQRLRRMVDDEDALDALIEDHRDELRQLPDLWELIQMSYWDWDWPYYRGRHYWRDRDFRTFMKERLDALNTLLQEVAVDAGGADKVGDGAEKSSNQPAIVLLQQRMTPAGSSALDQSDGGAGRIVGEQNQTKSVPITIDVYLDTTDEAIAQSSFEALDAALSELGVEDLSPGPVERGSFWRRASGKVREMAESEGFQERLRQVEYAIQLAQISQRQAEADVKTAEAVNRILAGLADVPKACVRIGSLLIVKYSDATGPVVLTTQLSREEIAMFEKYPELQHHPEKIFDALALAVAGSRISPRKAAPGPTIETDRGDEFQD
jgi:hypothetical protein